ncbi:hypothetical protein ES332_D13G282300v1 [Gossypium tomentosum]|uniref:Uncharacterized protein n=1 Tax=Gossypium tomentosum TaxID=34277 RepID=A0A5D2I334_GOSTO|nr:hypothetical protein ES332_D13G282300v1 [Gossypium tomentosum]
MGEKMRFLVLVLAISMMVARSCSAANKLKLEDAAIVNGRRLLDDSSEKHDYLPSSVNNYHVMPRKDFGKYENGGDGRGLILKFILSTRGYRMGEKMRFLVLVLAISMMAARYCSAANKLKLEDAAIVNGRRLLDDSSEKYDSPPSSVNNHHYIPRKEFGKYENGGDGRG